LTQTPLQIVDGAITVPDKPGLGVDPDLDSIEAAHQLYKTKGLGERNDAVVMQYFLPNWQFDSKRPSFVR
jgi:glucarate dehydratase